MPLYRRLPKRGFKSFSKKDLLGIINLSQIQNFIDKKRLMSADVINLNSLKKNKLIGKKFDKLKVLGTGDIKNKLKFEVHSVSNSAKNKIEKSGGIVNIIK